MDWEAIKTEYLSREEEERKLGIDKIREQYEEIVENMSQADVTAFVNGNPPKALMAIVEPDPKSSHFLARDFPGVVIGNVMDIMSKYVPVEEETE